VLARAVGWTRKGGRRQASRERTGAQRHCAACQTHAFENISTGNLRVFFAYESLLGLDIRTVLLAFAAKVGDRRGGSETTLGLRGNA
jgi:hypothetical protein